MKKIRIILLSLLSFYSFASTLFVSTANPNAEMASAISNELFANPAKSLTLSNPAQGKESEKANLVLSNWNFKIQKNNQLKDEKELLQFDLVITTTQQEVDYILQTYPSMAGKVFLMSTCAGQPKIDIADTANLDNMEDVRDQIYRYETLISSNYWKCLKFNPSLM